MILLRNGLLPAEEIDQLNREQKIAVYRSYFRVRTDVYAKRYINRKGEKGWCPACRNEFQGNCPNRNRQKFNCITCAYQSFPALSDEVLSGHFTGTNSGIGGYPIFPDTDTCYLLAIDFDDDHWFEEMKAIFEVSHSNGLYPVMERSASGTGGHLRFSLKLPSKHIRQENWERCCCMKE